MREALGAFNLRQAELLLTEPEAVQNVRMGIGLNVGPCSVGNMGSLQRFDYSALGDPVNVAARLEALTKSYGVDVLAAPAVCERVPDFAWIEIDEVKVKGRKAATKLFTLLGDAAFARTVEFTAWRARHEAMLVEIRTGRAAEARRAALKLAEDSPAHWRPLYEALGEKYGATAEAQAVEAQATDDDSSALDQLLHAE
jgi:adenylate cyclase